MSAIILNYHNDYNRFSETEEIFNEMSSKVIYKKNNGDEKEVWTTPKRSEMLRDQFYYSFSESKLLKVTPALRTVGKMPHLT